VLRVDRGLIGQRSTCPYAAASYRGQPEVPGATACSPQHSRPCETSAHDGSTLAALLSRSDTRRSRSCSRRAPSRPANSTSSASSLGSHGAVEQAPAYGPHLLKNALEGPIDVELLAALDERLDRLVTDLLWWANALAAARAGTQQ
jgi:hypothetical protein